MTNIVKFLKIFIEKLSSDSLTIHTSYVIIQKQFRTNVCIDVEVSHENHSNNL